jgi:outer membrane protein assembly factor BamB
MKNYLTLLPLPRLIPLAIVAGTIGAATAQEPTEPAPRLTLHHAPPPLAAEAIINDWPRFLGPNDNATSGESPLSFPTDNSPPPVAWELNKGDGYAAPSIVGGKLLLFHRLDDKETLECRHAESGALLWSQAEPVEYRDRYGFSPGPRAAPVIDSDRVYTMGVTGRLQCRQIEDGKLLWSREINDEYKVPQYFFGTGPSPLVFEDKLILNVGGRESESDGVCVVALDKTSGATLWETRDAWGASYASPVMATLHGKDRLLVFAGGESKPPTGGLLCMDPATGEVNDRFPWRADKFESVNASTPVVIAPNHVYLSECYQRGGVMLEFDEAFKASVAWEAPDFGMHWMTPVEEDGYLYGFRGRNEPDAWLACYNASTGKEQWQEDLSWRKVVDGRNFGWGFFRGSLLRTPDKWICLGEYGTLALFELTSEGATVLYQADLFHARESWTLPVLHSGLLYISQNSKDIITSQGPRLICYDLRPPSSSQPSSSQGSAPCP